MMQGMRSIARWSVPALVVAVTAGTAWAQETPFVGKVARDEVTVRAQASGAHARIGSLKRGDEVVVQKVVRDWIQIELPSSFPIWISSKYVKVDGDQGTVTGSRVNLRPSPDTAGSVLGQATRGEQLRVVGREGEWLQVLPPKSARGWMLKSLVEYVRPGDDAKSEGQAIGREPKVDSPAAPAPVGGPDWVERAREAAGRVMGDPLGKRDFAPAKQLLEQAKASNQWSTKAQQLERMISDAEAKDDQFRDALADVTGRYERENQALQELLAKIQRRVQQIGEEKPEQPFTAIGTFDAMGMVWNCPGTHEVVNDKGVRFYLKSASLNLEKARWYGKKVGVRGQVVEIPGWGRVIEVHEITLLEPLKRKQD